MTGEALKTGREEADLTQQEAASKLGLTQAYLSMLERGRRPVTPDLAAQAAKLFNLPPTALPLEAGGPSTLNDSEFKSELGALGYRGFSYLRGESHYNPARLLFLAIDRDDLDRRVVEALPWLTFRYSDLDWEWLLRNAKPTIARTGLGSSWILQRNLRRKRGTQRERKASPRIRPSWIALGSRERTRFPTNP